MTDKNTPAFPRVIQRFNDTFEISEGMTLRDYFASQTLVSMGTWAPVEPEEWSHRDVVQKMRAEWAYEQADAMLAARDK